MGKSFLVTMHGFKEFLQLPTTVAIADVTIRNDNDEQNKFYQVRGSLVGCSFKLVSSRSSDKIKKIQA